MFYQWKRKAQPFIWMMEVLPKDWFSHVFITVDSCLATMNGIIRRLQLKVLGVVVWSTKEFHSNQNRVAYYSNRIKLQFCSPIKFFSYLISISTSPILQHIIPTFCSLWKSLAIPNNPGQALTIPISFEVRPHTKLMTWNLFFAIMRIFSCS